MSPLEPEAPKVNTYPPAVLVCIVAGNLIEVGRTFPVIGENGKVWEILLGGEYRKINKQSGRVTGWKTPPKFALQGE